MERESLYFLTDESGATYYEDNGVIKKSATELKVLPNSPDGWKDKVVNYGRNATYYGIFRSFTIPLKFIKSGAHILRSVVFKLGIEAIVFLVILRLNKLSGKYQSFYKGELDFSKIQAARSTVQVNVLEGGFPKYLKAYESTPFEIELSGSDAVDLKMDGCMLQKKINYRLYNEPTLITSGPHTLPVVVINEEGTSFGALSGDSHIVGSPSILNDDELWSYKNVGTEAIVVTLNGFINATVQSGNTDPATYDLGLQRQDGTGINLFYNNAPVFSLLPAGGLIPIVNKTITVNPGERLYFIGNTDNCGITYDGGELSITFKSKFKTTYIKAINPFALGEILINNMAGSSFSLNSTVLANCDIYLTCGDAIRGIANAKIKTNWKDFFTSFNRNLCLGLSYTDTEVQVNERTAYYQSGVIYDLGEVKNAVFTIEESMICNTIKVGYAPKDYDDVNGRDEYNNTQTYKSPITRIVKEFDLTAPYRADMYGIEFIRINLEGKTTTDDSSDNDVFMIVVEKDTVANDGTFRLKREIYDNVEGLVDPDSAFNIQLSPKRIMLKHGAWIRSMMWAQDSKMLTFQTTDKNPNLKTVKGSTIVEEKADILIGSLPAPYFLPISVKFETIVPDDLLNIMDANSYGVFKFTYLGKEYKMWAEECRQKPSDDASQEWKGLLCADNDLNNLIYG